jgi:type II secretory pathway pseudopilin PulG
MQFLGGDGILLLPTEWQTMTDRDRLTRFLQTTMRNAGRQLEEAKRAYGSARESALADLPTDENGRAQLVCRRHAERRAVRLDGDARPVCFDADHPDCEGCVEDIRDGCIETWE